MADPLVSVVMPAFNAGNYIRSSIDSVLQQTYTNIELIIVNDGSQDDTATIVKSYPGDRIRYIEQPNGGQCKASNVGLQKASGDLIRFFDADDVLNKEHIALQVQKMNNRTDAICSCEWGRFYDGNPDSAVFEAETVWKSMQSLDWLREAMKHRSAMMGGWLWLIPRAVIEKAGGWDERLSLNNDFEFSIRLLLHAKEVLFTAGARLYYRTGEQSLSVTKSRVAYEAALLSTKLGCGYLLEADSSREMQRLCANRYQDWLFQIYPSYPGICRNLEREIETLGGSDLAIDGGSVLKSLSVLFGWKISKRIQRLFYKLGYKPKYPPPVP